VILRSVLSRNFLSRKSCTTGELATDVTNNHDTHNVALLEKVDKHCHILDSDCLLYEVNCDMQLADESEYEEK